MTRVLVAVDESVGPLAAVRALRGAGYEPWVLTPRLGTYAERSRAVAGTTLVPFPAGETEAFLAATAEAAARVGAAVVLPATESSLVALAGRTIPGAAVGAPERERVLRAVAKSTVAELAAAAGLESLPTAPAEGDIPFGFPLVLKLASTTIRAGATRRIESRDELQRAVEGDPPGRWIVQPFVAGELEAVFGLAWKGELVCAGRMVAERTWPALGGSSFARSLPLDDLEHAARAVVHELGWSGIFHFQFIAAGDRRVLIDLNPRVYGSLALAIASGLNLPVAWADLVLGREPRAGAYRPGARYRNEERDPRAIRAAGDLAALLPRRRTAHAVFSLRDPAPFLLLLEKAARRVVHARAGSGAEAPMRPSTARAARG